MVTRGHRHPHPLITGHFKEVGTVRNSQKQSNCKYYVCLHCDNPTKIENPDDRCLKHLSNPGQCPNAPKAGHKLAAQAIQGKKQPVSTNGATEPILNDHQSEDAVTLSDANSNNEGQQAMVITKKRKGTSI